MPYHQTAFLEIVRDAPTGFSTGGAECLEFWSSALENCFRNHAACSAVTNRNWVPTRLLDLRPNTVGFYETSTITLVEGSEITAPGFGYATLSHVWGSSVPFQLTQSNYTDMKEGIATKSLPQCYRDAVDLARKLHMHYLWIDSLW